MALDSLTTPTILPPTSLDLDEQEPTSTKSTKQWGTGEPLEYDMPGLEFFGDPMTQTGGGGPNFDYDAPLPLETPLSQSLSGFAQERMQDPSRYDLGVVKQGVNLINEQLGESARQARVDMDEFYSSRGLVGSSVESEGQRSFLGDLERVKSERMFNLAREMANTYGQDVATAGSLGVQARAQELQGMGMAANDAYRYAVLEQSGGQFGAQLAQRESEFARSLGFSGEQLQQRESEFARSFGLSQQDLGLRAQQLQQQAELEGRSLDIQEATAKAEIELRAEQLQQQAELEGRSLNIEEARLSAQQEQYESQLQFQYTQLTSQLGISQQELQLQRDQMTAEYGDRQAERLHEMNLQEGTFEFQETQNALDRLLEQQALNLQLQGLTMEDAWREADRQLESQIENRALDLQQQGMERDQAYRQATLDLDYQALQQRRTESEQQTALSLHDIYLRALAAGAGDYYVDPVTGEPAPLPFPGGSDSYWSNYFSSYDPYGGYQPPPELPGVYGGFDAGDLFKYLGSSY